MPWSQGTGSGNLIWSKKSAKTSGMPRSKSSRFLNSTCLQRIFGVKYGDLDVSCGFGVGSSLKIAFFCMSTGRIIRSIAVPFTGTWSLEPTQTSDQTPASSQVARGQRQAPVTKRCVAGGLSSSPRVYTDWLLKVLFTSARMIHAKWQRGLQ